MIQKPKKTFFSTLDQENIYFGYALAQKAYFNALNFAIWIMSMSKQILEYDPKKGFTCARTMAF